MDLQDIKDIISIASTALLVLVLTMAWIGGRANRRSETPLIALYTFFRVVGITVVLGRLWDLPAPVQAVLAEVLYPTQVMANVVLGVLLVYIYPPAKWAMRQTYEVIQNRWSRLISKK